MSVKFIYKIDSNNHIVFGEKKPLLKLFSFHSHLPVPMSLSHSVGKSLMAEWFEQASQQYELYCHDLDVMSSNPGRVKTPSKTPWRPLPKCTIIRPFTEMKIEK